MRFVRGSVKLGEGAFRCFEWFISCFFGGHVV